jgi:hypothetical protein
MRPDQQADVLDALNDPDRGLKLKPQDVERMLTQLDKSPYGAGIAAHIARGDLAGMPGYKDLLLQVKQGDMTPSVHMAMEHAADLRARGVKDVAFEFKAPGDKLDLDVLVRAGDEIVYGVQLKDVQSVSGINSAAKKIAIKQLAGEIAGQKVAILDIHDLKGAVTDDILRSVEGYARRTNATFELRFQDGSITIPANGPTYP